MYCQLSHYAVCRLKEESGTSNDGTSHTHTSVEDAGSASEGNKATRASGSWASVGGTRAGGGGDNGGLRKRVVDNRGGNCDHRGNSGNGGGTVGRVDGCGGRCTRGRGDSGVGTGGGRSRSSGCRCGGGRCSSVLGGQWAVGDGGGAGQDGGDSGGVDGGSDSGVWAVSACNRSSDSSGDGTSGDVRCRADSGVGNNGVSDNSVERAVGDSWGTAEDGGLGGSVDGCGDDVSSVAGSSGGGGSVVTGDTESEVDVGIVMFTTNIAVESASLSSGVVASSDTASGGVALGHAVEDGGGGSSLALGVGNGDHNTVVVVTAVDDVRDTVSVRVDLAVKLRAEEGLDRRSESGVAAGGAVASGGGSGSRNGRGGGRRVEGAGLLGELESTLGDGFTNGAEQVAGWVGGVVGSSNALVNSGALLETVGQRGRSGSLLEGQVDDHSDVGGVTADLVLDVKGSNNDLAVKVGAVLDGGGGGGSRAAGGAGRGGVECAGGRCKCAGAHGNSAGDATSASGSAKGGGDIVHIELGESRGGAREGEDSSCCREHRLGHCIKCLLVVLIVVFVLVDLVVCEGASEWTAKANVVISY